MTTTRRELLSTTLIAALPAISSAQVKPSAFTLPRLPYPVDALEPYIDARTMEIHHGKHHQAYVDNLNKALSAHPELAQSGVQSVLGNLAAVPESIRQAVRNNGGGHLNHSLFWQTLGPAKTAPKGRLSSAIDKSFGGRSAFEEKLRAAGLSVFGSGWVWVTAKGRDTLQVETSPNQDGPWLAGATPLFGLDVWEHAYYLKYQNRRADYLAALLQVVNWEFLTDRYIEITK
ncbi:superoxide dismutase [Paludibaculum fermentans]|uniref:superoxide dismutase n=1 Tax=Paludibaculum fermentans TaxID=1473598 RepID=UPI003EB98BA4